MQGFLWRGALGRSLGSHDAAELVGGDVPWQWLSARDHPLSRYLEHKYRIELPRPQPSAPPGTGSTPPREQSPICRWRQMVVTAER